MRKFIILVLVTSMLAACKEETGISEVTVRSPSFEVLKVVSEAEDLAYIESTWRALSSFSDFPVPDGQGEFKWYKLDVVTSSGKGAGRWLYDPRGYLMRPTKTLNQRYRVKDVDKLNEVLGI